MPSNHENQKASPFLCSLIKTLTANKLTRKKCNNKLSVQKTDLPFSGCGEAIEPTPRSLFSLPSQAGCIAMTSIQGTKQKQTDKSATSLHFTSYHHPLPCFKSTVLPLSSVKLAILRRSDIRLLLVLDGGLLEVLGGVGSGVLLLGELGAGAGVAVDALLLGGGLAAAVFGGAVGGVGFGFEALDFGLGFGDVLVGRDVSDCIEG